MNLWVLLPSPPHLSPSTFPIFFNSNYILKLKFFIFIILIYSKPSSPTLLPAPNLSISQFRLTICLLFYFTTPFVFSVSFLFIRFFLLNFPYIIKIH
ncbi:hypothetical protein VIGAN_09099700 [Vigna angularis var. angularis]|uniref:Uncharacterized protein n=1 Tax=Vigna angularis var. angularis TaxID=157739 RepID=A0A0S3SXL1_PHAAN|nr:hypothetical protein VIGAN_09099700 [Vigna angularis var. angularis]